MKSSIFAVLAGIAVVAVIAWADPDRLAADAVYALATAALGLSVAFLGIATHLVGRGRTQESLIGSYGLVGGGSFGICLIAGLAFTLAAGNHNLGAVIACAVAALLFVGLLMLARYSDQTLDAIGQERAISSTHGEWAVQLANLATIATTPALRAALQERAQACRYLARDRQAVSPLAPEIGACLSSVSSHVEERDEGAVMAALGKLDALLRQRETMLRQARSAS